MIYAGDLNVAHQEIDLKMRRPTVAMRASLMKREPAFEGTGERIYRYVPLFLSGPDRGVFLVVLYVPGESKNAGWRIDYFVVSECLKDRLADAKIHTEILGSDHCPIELDLK